MTVFISNMKMPKSCLDCPMINNEDWCVLQKIPINDSDVPSTWEELKKGCPLKERAKGRWLISNITDRHGRPTGNHRLRCDQCGKKYYLELDKDLDDYKLCPCCGADMRGESDD